MLRPAGRAVPKAQLDLAAVRQIAQVALGGGAGDAGALGDLDRGLVTDRAPRSAPTMRCVVTAERPFGIAAAGASASWSSATARSISSCASSRSPVRWLRYRAYADQTLGQLRRGKRFGQIVERTDTERGAHRRRVGGRRYHDHVGLDRLR